jgi:hypothetical protein
MVIHCNKLEDDVLVVLVAQQILALDSVFCSLFGLSVFVLSLCGNPLLSCGLFCGSIALLLGRDLFQAVELLSVELVELRVDVLDCVFGAGDNDVLAGRCQYSYLNKWWITLTWR